MSKLFIKNFNPKLYEKLEDFCSKNGKSKKEVVEEALNLFFNAQADSKAKLSLRQIITKYRGKCKKCGRIIELGEIAYWSQGVLLCIDCFLKQNEKIQDVKTIYKLYKQIKRLKAMKKEAERELDDLIVKVNKYETLQLIEKQLENISNIVKELSEYLYAYHIEDNKNLAQILEELRQIKEKIEEYLTFESISLRKVKRYSIMK